MLKPIPQHVSYDKKSKVFFPEVWRLEVFLNGVRTPYVTEAFAGVDGWVMKMLPPPPGFQKSRAGRATVKVSGHVELRWRTGDA